MKFILTIDTEGDYQWDHGRELTVKNIEFVPRLQEVCEKWNIRPTYLITSDICEDAFAKELLSEYASSDRAEIGAHLHAWTTPPFQDRAGFRFNDVNHTFASELPEDLLGQKVRILTAQIEKAIGRRPTSFRSGRFGFNEGVAKALIDNSYLVDSSVTPFTDWRRTKGAPGGQGGPDFMDAGIFPWRYEFENGSLIEIPLTILPTRYPLSINDNLARWFFKNVDSSIPLRILRRVFFRNQPIWLAPNYMTSTGPWKELLSEAIRIDLPFIVMMFHSSELMPGCSGYRPDNESIEALYKLLNNFFSLLSERNINSVTLTEAALQSGL